ncbi:hypothetical protein QP166_16615 [Sphingomonas sp. LR60]|uniref:hypothetical protein n=1 Tax=Sphingomonas sp. LR60 TaxID=3050233 RepID=UPI002FE01035
MRLGGLFGFGRAARSIHTVEDAIAAAAEAMPTFAAYDAVIGDDGRAALTIDATGRLALIVVRGARVRARVVDWPMLRLIDGGVLIETRDRRMGTVVLNRLTAIDIRRLGMPPLPQREKAEIVPEPAAAA